MAAIEEELLDYEEPEAEAVATGGEKETKK
jgi:hypothetical protein